MPNVDDHGLEVLKKAARDIGLVSKRDYALQVHIVNPGDISGGGSSLTEPVEVEGTVSISGPVQIADPVEVEGTVSISGPVQIADPVEVEGSITLIENLKQRIMNAADRIDAFTWLDFGTCNQRVDFVVYSASSVSTQTAKKTFNYTSVGSKFRLDTIEWELLP